MNQANLPSSELALRKCGAVAVVRRDEKWLVIRRSARVRAPRKLCFPGGTIEAGEAESDAIMREMQEELGVKVIARECVWRCVTPWNVALAFWTVTLSSEMPLTPNLDEVEEILWLTTEEVLKHPDLLESASDFFEAYLRGEVRL